jgi:hypothetical protein
MADRRVAKATLDVVATLVAVLSAVMTAAERGHDVAELVLALVPEPELALDSQSTRKHAHCP